MAANILVFAERREGALKRPSLEVLSTARQLAGALGGRVDVLALGVGASECSSELGKHGADRLLVMEDAWLDGYSPEAYSAATAAAVAESEAALVLFPATIMGKDLASRVAASLEAALMSDVTSIEIGEDGAVRCRRPVFSGKAMATVAIPTRRPAFATLRPNVFPVVEQEGQAGAEVVSLSCDFQEDQIRVRAARLEKPAEQELDVAEASIIVSGGRGIKDPKNFELIRSLAKPLNAAVGASRAAVDAGWIAHAHQVGQTGKVVSPNLYVACGISGAIQHLAGMSSAKVIVAINKDAEAPIFKIADYGIVGDLFEVIPKIVEELEKLP
jgi:electron transfer flavoprotein alpha subunit